jgi:hypothetical protein
LQNQRFLKSTTNGKSTYKILKTSRARGEENNEDIYPSRKFYYLPEIILCKVLRFQASQKATTQRAVWHNPNA